jgi:hypothetical protein
MSLGAHLLDHRVQVWRRTTTLGDLREEIRAWAKVCQPIRCAVNRPSASLSDAGAGLAPEGLRRVYANPDEDVEPRDVLQFVTGPDAPGTFEVDAPVTRPRGHHLEATCRLWKGKLT